MPAQQRRCAHVGAQRRRRPGHVQPLAARHLGELGGTVDAARRTSRSTPNSRSIDGFAARHTIMPRAARASSIVGWAVDPAQRPRRERAARVRQRQRPLRRLARQPGREEPGVEAVARARGVHHVDRRGRTPDLTLGRVRRAPPRAALDHHQRAGHSPSAACSALVQKQQVDDGTSSRRSRRCPAPDLALRVHRDGRRRPRAPPPPGRAAPAAGRQGGSTTRCAGAARSATSAAGTIAAVSSGIAPTPSASRGRRPAPGRP